MMCDANVTSYDVIYIND